MLKKLSYLLVFPVLLLANSVAAGPFNGIVTKNETSLVGVVNTGIGVFIWIAGILSVVFIMVGGFQYITAGTSKDGATKAKNTITYAIIGLVIVVLALVIRNFVLTQLNVAP